ncbi:hypothetical protein ACJRO7_033076 [Eucalyptus globulus]|uniref:pectinesterase n=1 Tax=Eucalyptus globulus TaxID=34317 RepID=A0ABD3JLF5_EUCGL
MQYSFLSTLLLALLSLSKVSFSQDCSDQTQDSETIIVDQSGEGQFTTVQEAIDSVPAKNSIWTHILVKPGIYKEKVVIPANKPCIVLEGNSASDTMIDATFTLSAENFKAKNIGFKNTYNENAQRGDRSSIKPASAFQITSDKVSFYQCRFIGRHYFDSCYIEGAIDFIWGNGQSVYQGCKINATTDILDGLPGYITAQGRNSATDDTGYVFKECSVEGTGTVYLGRAYKQYSRVVFYKGSITFVENKCTGAGADSSERIKWEKTLSSEELDKLTDTNTFINQDGWLQKQPF